MDALLQNSCSTYKTLVDAAAMTSTVLSRAVETAGSQSEFGRRIGASQQRVSYWLAQGKELPAEFVLTAEREFGVPRHVWRPDIYPAAPAPSAEIAA